MALLLASKLWTKCMAIWSKRDTKMFVIIIVCAAMCVDGAIFGVPAPVLPFLIQDEGYASKAQAPRIVALLNAAFSIADFFSAPLCAIYVDRTASHRRAWAVGIFSLVLGTLLFCFSSNLIMLVFSQGMQGASSGCIYIICLAILVDAVDASQLARFTGLAMSCSTFGQVGGPMAGGAAYEQASNGKRAVTGISMSLAGVAVVLLVLIKKPRKTENEGVGESVKRVDSDICLSTLSTSTEGDKPPTSTRPSNPTRQPEIFAWRSVWILIRSPRLLAAIYGIFIFEFLSTALSTTIPLYVQSLFTWTSSAAGLLFLCPAFAALFGCPAGCLTDRWGARIIAVPGLITTLPSLFCLAFITHDSLSQKVALCALLTLSASTMQFFMAALGAEFSLVAAEVFEQTGSDLRATSFCLLNCAIAVGGVTGPFSAGYLFEAAGWRWVSVLLGCVCATGVVPCLLLTGNKGEKSFRADMEMVKKRFRAMVTSNEVKEAADMREV